MRVRTSPRSAPLPALLVQKPAGQSHRWQSMFSFLDFCPGSPPRTLYHSGVCIKLRHSINYRLQADPSPLLEPPRAPGQEDGTSPWIFGRHIHSGVRQQTNIHAGHPVIRVIHIHTPSCGRSEYLQARGMFFPDSCYTFQPPPWPGASHYATPRPSMRYSQAIGAHAPLPLPWFPGAGRRCCTQP